MIEINDIVKFSDYKDIYLESKDCFVYQTQSKKYNIKGTNVEKYISPIFYKMFQPNFVSDLLEYVKDKFKNEEDVEIVGDDFLGILFKLYKFGLIELLEKGKSSTKNKTIADNFKVFNVNQKVMNDILKFKTITIVNFLNLEDIKPLIAELKEIPFKNINLINFHVDIENIAEENLCTSSNQRLKITYQKYSNILNFIDNLLPSNLLITLQSAKNIEFNSFINKYSIRFNIPWLNCVINDTNIEIGPLVVCDKTACYDCYKYLNQEQEEVNFKYCGNNIKSTIKTYQVYRKSNLYIAFGYILDEILKLFCYENIHSTPITVNNIITMNGLNLSYAIKPILKNPNCKTCGHGVLKIGN
ncbi:hypothetical protein [Anaerosalibacter sp. Marseille-P3206]|uniref:hypothetical protein n=1 Tax=Anaerosalibacter sp. Marseille-P3206 TaxID=1871005 RepID=UPI000986F3BC|nr:hypothetical protein [Anaerosalibacter sp. Marseille-P3206]